jgi:hypothetical protein
MTAGSRPRTSGTVSAAPEGAEAGIGHGHDQPATAAHAVQEIDLVTGHKQAVIGNAEACEGLRARQRAVKEMRKMPHEREAGHAVARRDPPALHKIGKGQALLVLNVEDQRRDHIRLMLLDGPGQLAQAVRIPR